MKSHKLLYVDRMTPDRMKGIVTNRDKLIYNIELIHPETAEKFKESIIEYQKGSVVMIAGRYICVVTMELKESGEGVLIINLDNNPEGVDEMERKFTNPLLKERMKTAFEAIKNTPDGYYDFELELGDLPSL